MPVVRWTPVAFSRVSADIMMIECPSARAGRRSSAPLQRDDMVSAPYNPNSVPLCRSVIRVAFGDRKLGGSIGVSYVLR